MSHEVASHTIGPAQVSAAVQATLHVLPPHVIPRLHEPAPTQLTMHALEVLQSIVRVHDPAPVQVTVQGMPGGQTTGSSQAPPAVHVTMHVPLGSQVPTPVSTQREGHIATASTAGTSGRSRVSCASMALESDVIESRSESTLVESTDTSPSRSVASPIVPSVSLTGPSEPIVTSGNVHAGADKRAALIQARRRGALVTFLKACTCTADVARCESRRYRAPLRPQISRCVLVATLSSAFERANELILRVSCIAETFRGSTTAGVMRTTTHPLTRLRRESRGDSRCVVPARL